MKSNLSYKVYRVCQKVVYIIHLKIKKDMSCLEEFAEKLLKYYMIKKFLISLLIVLSERFQKVDHKLKEKSE